RPTAALTPRHGHRRPCPRRPATARHPPESAAERRCPGHGNYAVRPFLLSAGLALMGFALLRHVDVEGDLPGWGVAALMVTRFLLALVGAWLAVTAVRLVIAGARLGWTWARTQREGSW